ncbi:phosphoribosylamine--glycine ligase [Knoellia koreensis]|jgi:nitrous oxidase accessory protein NosD|uniref:Phosphoribosylamine--glycine ligase n=1 Tax=Knoellia koreensis TaxID=2730921 RepID=A0A849HHS6_9MICO|nr:phosphoribosylamine--glycine ligase [Knoellia sp. DB2414S]NNM46968.1 phosphoribosylamine--glycine ligase [Knoellia sp. DB2414S]
MTTEAAALLISAVSLLLAGLSLGWQIAQWLLSAGRPKAVLMHGVWQGAGAYVGPVTADRSPLDLNTLRRQGIDGLEVVGIRVTNHGRAPVSVEWVAVHCRGGTMVFVPEADRLGPGLPYRLEAGTNTSWYVDVDRATRLASSSREVLREPVTGVYMTAQLGTGKTIETSGTLRT